MGHFGEKRFQLFKVTGGSYLQLNSFIPMDDVATQRKRLRVNNVNVALFGSHVKPFTAHRKMDICDAGDDGSVELWKEKGEINFLLKSLNEWTARLFLTFLFETSNNAQRSEFSSESSRSEVYRRLLPSPSLPRSPGIRFGWRRTQTRPRDVHEHRRLVDPIFDKWEDEKWVSRRLSISSAA